MATSKPVHRPEEVDAYLAALPADQRAALEALRRQVRRVAPAATERVAYGVPSFHQDGPLVSLGAFRHHLSLISQSPALIERLADRLRGLDVSGSTIRFRPDDPLPEDVVELVVRERLAENAARRAGR
ncbi:iron chaperone [Actinotalea sp. Marseille-Q4924]|uniref:iron chaperone n=1 Tax=Actinotalea sp. Marseille-Q4924 TaxID=2866571 RepID=UPI001CE3F14B|nr:DUF1801 domain-containing protein [Actinotalea sp. Marseille-Q4924]